jgi:hypothetical protein
MEMLQMKISSGDVADADIVDVDVHDDIPRM